MAVKRHQQHFDMTARDGTAGPLAAVERNLNKVSDAASRMGQTFRAVIGATVLAGLTRETARAAMEAEQAQNRLNAVWRATGGVAGVTRKEIDALAKSLAETTQFDDEAFGNAAAALTKFGNIHGQVFRDAMAVSADFAAFMGTDVPHAAEMLGKALQAPTEAISGPHGIGAMIGKLTEEQEKHIKSLAAQGRAIEAQAALLDIVKSKIGGTADLMNTGLTQATTGVTKAWNDMLEAFGRSEKIGGPVRDTLLGIRDILREIADMATAETDPFAHYTAAIRKLDEEIERLEQTAKNARQRGGPGGNRIAAAAEERLRFVRAQQTALHRDLAGRRAGISDQEAFEAGMLPAPKIVLGGKTSDDDKGAAARAQREAEFRSEKAVELEEMAAQDSREAWEAYTKGRIEQEERIRKERDEGLKALFESIDLEQEEAIRQGEEVLEAERARKEALEESGKAARDLGLIFTSAAEDAIVEWKSFDDVLKGIEKDLLRFGTRKLVTEPLLNAAGKAFEGVDWGGMASKVFGDIFGGARADGGAVRAGRPYLVGEKGPELFVPGSSGRVMPNDALAPVQVVVNVNGATNPRDFRAAAPQIAADMSAALSRAQRVM
jgi:hypothetical protein